MRKDTAVSYNIHLRAKDGFVIAEHIGGGIPDGTFEISGHWTPEGEELGINRREPDGRYAVSAKHAHSHPAVPAPPEPDEDPF
jgi:hypothetical protein